MPPDKGMGLQGAILLSPEERISRVPEARIFSSGEGLSCR